MRRIVVLGGGFAGVAAIQRLDRLFRDDDAIELVLLSNTNYLVYTPMLAEVAGGTLMPGHAVSALRSFLKKARLRVATIDGIDLTRQTVQGTLLNGERAETPYDYLVIALGAVTNFSPAAGAAEHALGLKDLLDAFLVRNRALTLLELANTTHDLQQRRALLTFVIAGGGFSGVEGIAALEDLLHGALRYYPDIARQELRFVLASLDQRLLPEVDARLGAYVVEQLHRRAIDVRLGVGVAAVTDHSVTLTTGEVVPTHMVVWTGGISVNPIVQRMALPATQRGALVVTGQLQVAEHPTIFAVGDCAAVPLPDGQGSYTPTAQNAIRQGQVAAANIAALICGTNVLQTFRYRPIGSFASLGQRQAVAEIGPLRLAGLPAWLAWRAIYLAKMPTFADKLAVGLEWLTELITPADTVQLPITREPTGAVPARQAVAPSVSHETPSRPVLTSPTASGSP